MTYVNIILIVLMIVLIMLYRSTIAVPNMPTIRYKKLRSEKRFKTGDIILFHAVDNCYPLIIGEYYGHVAVVWVDPDDPDKTPYVFEAARTKGLNLEAEHNTNGIFLSPLDNRFNKYRGYMMYRELAKPIDEKIVRNFKEFIEYSLSHMRYDDNYIPIAICHKLGHGCDNNTNCAELVFLSMIKLGLLPLEAYDWCLGNYLSWVNHTRVFKKNRYLDDVYMIDHPF